MELTHSGGVSLCLCAEKYVPHRRRIQKGSFSSHFDELVVQFPVEKRSSDQPSDRSLELQEKIEIHALLFKRAWQMDEA
jgi:hypothetical protein